jgi:REP element-mobilizing transposase RayT
VNFGTDVRITILREFICKMRRIGINVIAGAIGKRHLHALAELPFDYAEMKKVIGRCKQKSSHAVRDILPGIIWAEGGEFNRIKDRDHLHNTYEYIRTKQEPGTVVWSHRHDEDWIDHPEVGVIVMGLGRKHIRVFGVPQTPASEVLRRPGSKRKKR